MHPVERTLFANLSGALQAAVVDGKIRRNPCSLVKPPRVASSTFAVRSATTASSGSPRSRRPACLRRGATGFHALRHHFASVLLANAVDVRALASYLGHTDSGFTLRVYTHLMPDAADRMRAAVDHVLATGGVNGPSRPREGRYDRASR